MEEPVRNCEIYPVPTLPRFSQRSPEVVRVLDRIRFQLRDKDGFDEFCWFAREYPRCYRYHLDCAEHRIRSIHSIYCDLYREMSSSVAEEPGCVSYGISNVRVNTVYWDFESYLSAINISLDLLARIVGTAFPDHMPSNFNKLSKKNLNSPVLALMKTAKARWVDRLKDYRDCFTHYTPVDTMLFLELNQYRDGHHIRAKLPVNPNAREILGFKYSRRTELFRYSCTVWRHMSALDRAVARELARSFRAGEYPKRTEHLFFVGRRERG